ncbi:MAG: fasciclin domain-containing protein [Gemmataceae bacterium]|nr:fasciclin domain-containing protein [Gemmataceae bacterium]
MRNVVWASALVASFSCAGAATAQTCPTDRPHPVSALQPNANPDIVKTAAAAGQFKTLLNCLIAADLLDAVRADGPFVVFAPTDEAFAKLPQGTLENLLKPENKAQLAAILKLHVVAGTREIAKQSLRADRAVGLKSLGGTLSLQKAADAGDAFTVNGTATVQAVAAARNGTVYVIDSVLLPARNTIPTVADKAGTFKTLLAALTAADLAEVLNGDGPFTVFAPTDEAFAKLPKGTVEALLKPENKDRLVAILKYHVVAGKVLAKDAVAAGTAKTLQGATVTANIVDGRLTINKSNVIRSDVAAENGVIHVVDAVLLPPKH